MLLFLLIFCFSFAHSQKQYSDHTYLIFKSTQENLNFRSNLYKDETLDFLQRSPQIDADNVIFLKPDQIEQTRQRFQREKIAFELEDVPHFDYPTPREDNKRISRRSLTDFKLTAFNDVDEQVAFMKSLAKKHSDFVELEVFGKSAQGKPLYLLKIGYPLNGTKKSGVFIDANIHAREWITSSTAFWIINELVTNSTHKDLLTKVDVYVVPMLNPDGYMWSRKRDRMWRRNRNHFSSNSESDCVGVDLNRNFPFHWSPRDIDFVPDQCHQNYPGPEPGSEEETKSLMKVLKRLSTLRAYIALHSRGDLILYPWGFAKNHLPPDVHVLIEMAHKIRAGIFSSRGNNFTVLNSADMYLAAGIAHDYAKSSGIKYSYTLELTKIREYRPTEAEIEPVGREVFAGILVLLQDIFLEILL